MRHCCRENHQEERKCRCQRECRCHRVETIVHPTVHCVEERRHHRRVRHIIPVVVKQVHHHHRHHEYHIEKKFEKEHRHHEHGKKERDWCREVGVGSGKDMGRMQGEETFADFAGEFEEFDFQ